MSMITAIVLACLCCVVQHVQGSSCPAVSDLSCSNASSDCNSVQAYIKLSDGTKCPSCTVCIDGDYVDDKGCPMFPCPLTLLPDGCAGIFYSQTFDMGDQQCAACQAYTC